MSGDLGPWLDQQPKPKPDADAAIRGFCEANPFTQAWDDARCQNQVNTALLAPYIAVPRPVRTEVDRLREELAAMKALVEALTPSPAGPLPNPLTRAVSLWPGSQGFIQGIRWRGV